MTLRELLAAMPAGSLVPRDWVLAMLEGGADEDADKLLTTGEASERFGMSSEWWAEQAGSIVDAWQSEPGAPWRLPLSSCRDHLARLKRQRSGNRSGRRGPYRQRDAA